MAVDIKLEQHEYLPSIYEHKRWESWLNILGTLKNYFNQSMEKL